MRGVIILLCLTFLSNYPFAQEKKTIASIQDLFVLVQENNLSFQQAELQQKLAEVLHKTAYVNVLNPKIPTSYQAINNQNLQVSFLPGQAFGLPEGTYKQVAIGQQFVATFTIQPQFDLLNLASFAQIKTTRLNEQLVQNQNKINQQILFEKLTAVYFNILALNAQKEIFEKNRDIAKQIVVLTQNKLNEGIARKQELNEAEINWITIQDKLEQLVFTLEAQYQVLNLFLENKFSTTLMQTLLDYNQQTQQKNVTNNLLVQNSVLQLKIAQQDLKQLRLQQAPVISFVSAYNWQNLSNDNFYSSHSNQINFNYVGLKMSYDFPTNVQKFSASRSKYYQVKIAELNATHSEVENENRNSQLLLDYNKSMAQLENLKKIVVLKEDSYLKSMNQFQENILPIDKLLIAQNDWMLSQLNVISTLATIGFNKTKIEIYNEN